MTDGLHYKSNFSQNSLEVPLVLASYLAKVDSDTETTQVICKSQNLS